MLTNSIHTVHQLVRKLTAFRETWMFISVLGKPYIGPYPEVVKSNHFRMLYFFKIPFNIILSRLGLLNDLFPSSFNFSSHEINQLH
jgi:hypothetical protein